MLEVLYWWVTERGMAPSSVCEARQKGQQRAEHTRAGVSASLRGSRSPVLCAAPLGSFAVRRSSSAVSLCSSPGSPSLSKATDLHACRNSIDLIQKINREGCCFERERLISFLSISNCIKTIIPERFWAHFLISSLVQSQRVLIIQNENLQKRQEKLRSSVG